MREFKKLRSVQGTQLYFGNIEEGFWEPQRICSGNMRKTKGAQKCSPIFWEYRKKVQEEKLFWEQRQRMSVQFGKKDREEFGSILFEFI